MNERQKSRNDSSDSIDRKLKRRQRHEINSLAHDSKSARKYKKRPHDYQSLYDNRDSYLD